MFLLVYLFHYSRLCGLVIKRRELFKQAIGTKKTLHLTMITSYGVEHNAGWQNIQNEVVLNDLFKVE